MRLLIIFLLIPALSGCIPEPPKPSVSVEKAIFQNNHWNLAVLDLEYTEIEGQKRSGLVLSNSAGADAGKIIGSLLASELTKFDNITIVERSQIDDLINEQKLNLSGIVKARDALEIGQMLGANAVLMGNVSDYLAWSSVGIPGSTVSFSMRIIDVKTGQVITSGSITKVENFIVAFQNAQNLTRKLVEQIAQQQ